MRYLGTEFHESQADLFYACIAHDFPAAVRLYSEAIEKNPLESTLWCNRAYARMKLEQFGYALSDASKDSELHYGVNTYLIIFQVKQ